MRLTVGSPGALPALPQAGRAVAEGQARLRVVLCACLAVPYGNGLAGNGWGYFSSRGADAM